MQEKGIYAFWDLVAEESYLPKSPALRKGTIDIFWDREREKNIWLFGCNDACREFIRCYVEKIHVAGILDNAKTKQNQAFEGLPVFSPKEVIPGLSKEQDTIVIAMRLNADAVAEQIMGLGSVGFYSLGVLVSGMEPYKEFIDNIRQIQETASLEDLILMESTNDFDGNSGALYEYLKVKGSGHKFVWIVKEFGSKKMLPYSEDEALCPRESLDDLKKYIYYRAVSKWQIWDNFPIRKVRKGQINVFMQHFGMGYKMIGSVYSAPSYVDYVLTTNENVYKYEKDSLLYAPDTKVIFGELPRNDVLFSRQWRELGKITPNAYDKVVMWAPTLRESKLHNRVDSDIEYPYGISVVYTEDEISRLNTFLAERNMLLIIKIHPRQKINYTDGSYGNIIYLDGENVKRIHPYKLMTQVDAMISDYSSIVFDYMLLDRPIAWALEDMEHYQIQFLMDNPLDFMPGEKIYCFEDLLTFLEHVKNGEDLFRQARNIIAADYNALMEGRGCENIARFLGL